MDVIVVLHIALVRRSLSSDVGDEKKLHLRVYQIHFLLKEYDSQPSAVVLAQLCRRLEPNVRSQRSN